MADKVKFASRLPGFYRLSIEERRGLVEHCTKLPLGALSIFAGQTDVTQDAFERMIENAIGAFSLPLGIAANFLIDGEAVLVPMAVEEPSVIAAASNMARLVAQGGGFKTSATPSLMRGQIQILDVMDGDALLHMIATKREELIALANQHCPSMLQRGGGCVDVCVRLLAPQKEGIHAAADSGTLMASIDVIIDCKDAMGANLINTMLEALSPSVEAMTGLRVGARILSNLSDLRMAKASCEVPYALLAYQDSKDDGEKIAKAMVNTYRFAVRDPYRAATHNKGIANGIDPLAVATGNDWRAIEAGMHAYAARSGRYEPLSRIWCDDEKRCLYADLEMPLAVGVVGGSTKAHRGVKTCLQIMGNWGQSSAALARVMVAVGLCENIASLRALSSEGIQKGHMALHRRKEQGA